MYSGWASLQHLIENEATNHSVLHSFPEAVGKDVAVSVVRQLASSLSLTSHRAALESRSKNTLDSDKQILWTMEVICYGLSLPLTEHDAVRDCVNVYCEWLTALTSPPPSLPSPLVKDPNPYAQKIFQHFVNLFKTKDQGENETSKQVVLCHRVLRTVQTVASSSVVMTRGTWEVLLKFMLAINNNLLAPPVEPGNLAEQLCERLLQVLCEVWLLACTRCFPPPTLWRTFREMCAGWRHHMETVHQWSRVCRILTSKLLEVLYGSNFPQLKVDPEEAKIVPAGMDPNTLAQTWFRFLHIINNPVDLSRPHVIGQTPKFLSYTISHDSALDPIQHPCLKTLPQIFLKAMLGISGMVDAFLGNPEDHPTPTTLETPSLQAGASSAPSQKDTPPQSRKVMKSHSIAQPVPDISSLLDTNDTNRSQSTLKFVPKRSECNSILHLFGAWLFEAALKGCKLHKAEEKEPAQPRRITFAYGYPMANISIDTNTTNSSPSSSTSFKPVGKMKRQNTVGSPADRDSHSPRGTIHARGYSVHGTPTGHTVVYLQDKSLDPESYEAGRAEACGSLCRLFTSRRCEEDIQPVYLARFYLTLSQGLKTEEPLSGLVLSSILYNAQSLFRIDLKGVQVLIPHVLPALELVLSEKNLKFRSLVSQQQLKRAAIHLLMSLVSLPHHFRNLEIKSLLMPAEEDSDKKSSTPAITFLSLKPRLVGLMLDALKCEIDQYNLQMLLGALHLCILDSALCEEYMRNKARMQETRKEQKLQEGEEEAERDATETEEDESQRRDSPESPLISEPHYSTWCLLVECCHLVCKQLITVWIMEYGVSLAALELLTGLAKVKIHVEEPLELKKIIKSVSYLIEHQCSWPSMYHSRDLHSVIVAAFQCLTVWLLEHSDLLQDRECLQCVLEVIELGISGTKSQQSLKDTPVMKQAKQSKPASIRVRDAAEAALSSILNHLGAFPAPCGPSSLVSLLDEESLLAQVDYSVCAEAKFRYFVLENTTLLGVLEESVDESDELLPTLTTLIRGPTGRTAWILKHRHIPKKPKDPVNEDLTYPKRPLPKEDVGTHHEITSRNYPESVDKIPPTKADKSIPSLSEIEDDLTRKDHEKLSDLIQDQIEIEEFIYEKASEEIANEGFPNRRTEAKPPRPKEDFSPARLLLSHLGYLSLDYLKGDPNSPIPPALIPLNETAAGFSADLRILDSISSRTFDTVHIFYVKSGQRLASNILSNVNSCDQVQSSFIEFLHSLGWPVQIGKHAGWTGHILTSWKMDGDLASGSKMGVSSDHGGCLYNGRKQVLYYADALSEIAFVVPNIPEPKDRSSSSDNSKRQSMVSEDSMDSCSLSQESQTLSVNNNNNEGSPRDRSETLRKLSSKGGPFSLPEIKIVAVWVENFEDCEHFPLGDILPETNTGMHQFLSSSTSSFSRPAEPTIILIFIHPLQSGLYRILMKSKSVLAIPLVNGMVVSRRTLGALIRQTAINICNRKRLETDSYSPPHVRRRQKIQDMALKYREKMDVPQFLASLFSKDIES